MATKEVKPTAVPPPTTVVSEPQDQKAAVPEVSNAKPATELPAVRPAHGVQPYGGASGDALDAIKVQVPRLKIIYGTSKLATVYGQGDLILQVSEQDHYLMVPKATAAQGLNMIILDLETFWKEYITKEMRAQDPNRRPQVFQTRDEVLAAGGRTDWPPRGALDPQGMPLPGPTHSPAGRFKLLIEKPKNLICGVFAIRIGEHEYCPAVWDVDKAICKSVSATYKSDLGFALREIGRLGATYNLVVSQANAKRQNGEDYIRVDARLKIARHHTPETVAAIKAALSRAVSYEAGALDDDEPLPF